MSINNTLRIDAVLSALKNETIEEADVMDALCHFFVPILHEYNGDHIDAEFLADAAKMCYGWNLTESVGELFLERLEKMDLVTAERNCEQKCYIAKDNPNLTCNVDSSIGDTFNEIIELFRDFHLTNENSELRELPNDELGMLLINYLINDDFNPTEQNRKLKELSRLKDYMENTLSPQKKVICARFVTDLSNSNPELAKYLTRFVDLGLLVEFVEDFSRPKAVETKSRTSFFLDAPVLLNLLGTSGKASENEMKLMIDALKSIGCKILAFSESCEEAERVLDTLLKTSPTDRYGPTHTAILEGAITEDFVKRIARNIESAVKNLGITVLPYDLSQYPNTHKHFNKSHHDNMYSILRWQEKQLARKHDAFVVTAVMRLRSQTHKRNLLENSHALISSSSSLIRSANEYCKKERLLKQGACGPIVNTKDIIALAWLNTGFDNRKKISISHMLAQCEKVLHIKEDVIKITRDIIKKYDPEKQRQYEALSQDSRAVIRMSDAIRTSANPRKNLSKGEELLDLMRAGIDETVDRRNTEIKDLKEQLKKKDKKIQANVQKSKRRLSQEKEIIKKSEKQLGQNNELKKKLKNAISEINKMHRTEVEKGIKYANLLFNIIIWGIFITLILIFYKTHTSTFEPFPYYKTIVSFITFISLAFQYLSIFKFPLLPHKIDNFFNRKISLERHKKRYFIKFCIRRNVSKKFALENLEINKGKFSLKKRYN